MVLFLFNKEGRKLFSIVKASEEFQLEKCAFMESPGRLSETDGV